MIVIGRGEGLFSTVEYLHAQGFDIGLIVTAKAYKEYGRTSGDFAELAKRIKADFRTAEESDFDLSGIVAEYVAKKEADVAISANWQFRLSSDLIRRFKIGILNCHMGQLPNYKGNAAANWMILQGESFMYVDVHKMNEQLDSGDIISRKKFDITEETYLHDLWQACNDSMPHLFEEALLKLKVDPSYKLLENSARGLRCFPRTEMDHQINWHLPAREVARLVRASARPLSGAYTFVDGKKVTIWRARAADLPYSFLAVPGHVVQLNKEERTVCIACAAGVLQVEEIEVAERTMIPTEFFKSIRKRCSNEE